MKVLVVEDSMHLRQNIERGLVKQGFVVDTAENGKEGLSYILSYAYDVIVLDIMLPEMDGFEVLKEIRDRRTESGVIMLTARDRVKDRVKGLEMGADDYLCKPFSFEELVARIKTIGRRNFSNNKFNLEFGEISVNISMKDLTVDGKAINLTPTEYSIVEYLALNAGKVIPFHLLEDKLCTSERSMTRNALEVNISNIRRKINVGKMPDFIKTKRGMGYYIESEVS